MTLAAIEHPTDTLRALPGDDVRQILWRFADRYDLQMLVQSVRAVARGPVARLVAAGARNTHEWTADKQALLQSFDESGITGRVHGSVAGRLHRGAEEPGAGAGGLRTGLGGRRGRDREPGRLPGTLADPRARHTGAARSLYGALRATAAGRRSQAVARRFLFDRADPLRRRRNRNAGRQGADQRVGGRGGAHAAGGKARPVHHEHGLRQFRDGRGGIGRSAHQRHVYGDSGRRRPGNFRPGHTDAQTGPPALLHAGSDFRAQCTGQPDHRRLHGEGRRDRAEVQPR